MRAALVRHQPRHRRNHPGPAWLDGRAAGCRAVLRAGEQPGRGRGRDQQGRWRIPGRPRRNLRAAGQLHWRGPDGAGRVRCQRSCCGSSPPGVGGLLMAAAEGPLFGVSSILEQLFLWSVAGNLVGAVTSPAMTAVTQDMQARHPLVALSPEVAAEAVAKHMLSAASGAAEAARGGIDGGRFATLARLATVRLSPEVLAQAVEHHLLGQGTAASEAELSGITKQWFDVLLSMAKVRLDPATLAQAVVRGIEGEGPAFAEANQQGISAGQFATLRAIAQLRIDPGTLAQLVTHNLDPEGRAEAEAHLQGMAAVDFRELLQLATVRLAPDVLAQAVTHNLAPAARSQA